MFWTIQSYTCDRVNRFSGLDKIAWIENILIVLKQQRQGLILPEWSDRRRRDSPRRCAGKNSFLRRNYCPGVHPLDHCAASSRGWSRGVWGGRHGTESPGGLRRKVRSDPPRFPFLQWTPPCRELRSPGRSWLSVRPRNPQGGSTVCGGGAGSGGRGVFCPREAWYPSPRPSPTRASRPPRPPPWGSPVYKRDRGWVWSDGLWWSLLTCLDVSGVDHPLLPGLSGPLAIPAMRKWLPAGVVGGIAQ